MKKIYQFIDADQDVAGAERIEDREQGSVLWLQTSPNGCYIPVNRLDEFIAGIKKAAASQPSITETAATGTE
ncbi:hypothetical protein QFZ63_001623 [Streptomyces sp. B3I7]|uniref:hypothetical protein n=1 Tax=Streptomyces sp. B3I7 TaxID=3042269 RepID=UPI0027838F47|nr:hypothetical protein [Streptomyces sp. B3I7]MDQ0809909.1 hypothetical protein [Streptomyces sp. B3I7]